MAPLYQGPRIVFRARYRYSRAPAIIYKLGNFVLRNQVSSPGDRASPFRSKYPSSMRRSLGSGRTSVVLTPVGFDQFASGELVREESQCTFTPQLESLRAAFANPGLLRGRQGGGAYRNDIPFTIGDRRGIDPLRRGLRADTPCGRRTMRHRPPEIRAGKRFATLRMPPGRDFRPPWRET